MTEQERDDFPSRTRRILGERAGYRCSRPECRRQTIGPHTDPGKSAAIGVAAHIKAAAPGGPRFDAAQSTEERASVLNGIWLCQTCSRLIDSDPLRFPESVLHDWKRRCEAEILAELDGLIAPRSPQDVLTTLVEQMLDEAFDTLAGDRNAVRVTWPVQTASTLEAARRTLARASTLRPDNPRIPLLQAIYLIAVGFPEKALELMDAAAIPDRWASDLRARCLTDLGRKGEIVSLLQATIDSGEATPTTYFNMGLAQADRDADSAMRSFEKAIAMDAEYAEAHRNLYELLNAAGRKADAAGHLEIAFSIKPTEPRIALNFAHECVEGGETSRALAVVDDALQAQPRDANLWALRAEIHGRLQDYPEASRCIATALAIDRTNNMALNNKLVLLLETNDEMGLRDYLDTFPLDEDSVPEKLREFVRVARDGLESVPAEASEPLWFTEEHLIADLLAQARAVKGAVAIPRFALCKLAAPSEADGFTTHGIALIVALTRKPDELPLSAVRLRTSSEEVHLECLAERMRPVPEGYGEISAKLGSFIYEGLFVCPLVEGVVEVDWRRCETRLLQVERAPDAVLPSSRKALLELARREFPYLAELGVHVPPISAFK